MPLTLAMIVMVSLQSRSLCLVYFHTSILVTKLSVSKTSPAVCTCCCLLLGIFHTALSKQHTRQVVEGCLAYESKQAAAKELLARGGNCIACREPPLWLHACPVSMPHIARRLLTPSAAWALLLLLQPPYPSQSSRPASKTEASRSCRYKVMSCVCVCVLLPVVAAEVKKSLCECTPCLNVIGV